jgi:hypothetical protein
MVEYALLLASNSFHSFTLSLGAWASTLNWHALWYGALGLLAFWVALWAFKTPD